MVSTAREGRAADAKGRDLSDVAVTIRTLRKCESDLADEKAKPADVRALRRQAQSHLQFLIDCKQLSTRHIGEYLGPESLSHMPQIDASVSGGFMMAQRSQEEEDRHNEIRSVYNLERDSFRGIKDLYSLWIGRSAPLGLIAADHNFVPSFEQLLVTLAEKNRLAIEAAEAEAKLVTETQKAAS